MAFVKATKKKSKARVALLGPSGAGKTFSALAIGKHLGSKIAVIDTERGSASKYADDVAVFDVCELETFEPQKYIDKLHEAAAEGYDVIIVDSLSHAWMGGGGILDQKDKKGGNGFDAWRTLTPQHNALVEAILAYPGHVIATMRSKMEYVQEKGANGKTVIRKVGMAPVQRDGMEYEFDVIGELDVDHCLHVTKSRCNALADQMIRKPGADLAKALLAWLDQGEAVAAPVVVAPPPSGNASSSGDGEKQSPKKLPPSMTAVLDLAEAICAAQDADVLSWAMDTIEAVCGDSEKLPGRLKALIEERAAQLADAEWAGSENEKKGAAWLRAEIEKRTEQAKAAA